MPETFPIRRSLRWLGATFLGLFVVALIVSVAIMWSGARPDKRILAVLIAGIPFSGFAMLSGYLWAAARRESITWTDGEIRFAGLFRDKTIVLDEITEASWIAMRLSTLKLTAGPTKVRIWFDNYHPDDHRRLMRLCRERISESVQTGWDESLERQMASADHWSVFWTVWLRFLLIPPLISLSYLRDAIVDPSETTRTGSAVLDVLIVIAGLTAAMFAVFWCWWKLMEWVERPSSAHDLHTAAD